MPNENIHGRRGSYTPGQDNLDSTPYKPVPLAFQQADGTLPADHTDRNGNAKNATRTRRQAYEDRERRKKMITVAVIILIAIIILLAIILPLAICLGTDLCSSSTTTKQASPIQRAYQVQMKATLTSPILSDPGNPGFSEFVNITLQSNVTGPESNDTTPAYNITEITRLKRGIDQIDIDQDQNPDHGDHSDTSIIDRYSATDRYVMDLINIPLMESIKSSALCQEIDCTDLKFETFNLTNDILSSQFIWSMGSDNPISIDPISIQDITNSTIRNFGPSFSQIFSGYRLGDIDLAFDLVEFCNFSFVFCYNFTDINDTIPSTTIMPDTTAMIDTTTVADRSELLPDIVQIFNDTTTMGTTSTGRTTTTRSTTSTSTTSTTSAPIVRAAPVPVPVPVVREIANCSMYGFQCANQIERVATRQRCDGSIECSDGSDEQLCETCRTSFSCPNGDGSWMCQRGKVLCDSKPLCPSDYDEGPVFCKAACLPSEYRCRNSGICIPKRWLCDGDTQCPEGDDEMDCKLATRCNNNAFFCAVDGSCIARWTVCDGKPDCSDGADEATCTCLECSGDRSALCSAPTGKCILRKQLCDGKVDCPNGEDEIKCAK